MRYPLISNYLSLGYPVHILRYPSINPPGWGPGYGATAPPGWWGPGDAPRASSGSRPVAVTRCCWAPGPCSGGGRGGVGGKGGSDKSVRGEGRGGGAKGRWGGGDKSKRGEGEGGGEGGGERQRGREVLIGVGTKAGEDQKSTE
jgi:hypothetical protein